METFLFGCIIRKMDPSEKENEGEEEKSEVVGDKPVFLEK